MKLFRLILLVLAWAAYPALAGAQDQTSQPETITVFHTVTLNWIASPPNSDPIYYNVYVSGMATGPYSIIGITSNTTFTDINPVSGNTYYYEVEAVDDTTGLNSDFSNIVMVPIP